MTILQQVEIVVTFMPYFRSIATHTVCDYRTNMKLISRGFQHVSAKYMYMEVKNDFADNNNKHFVTAFEAGSSRQGVGTVHASSNFAASHHFES